VAKAAHPALPTSSCTNQSSGTMRERIDGGVTSWGKITQKAPARTEPRPTDVIPHRSVVRGVDGTSESEFRRGNVVGQENAESPGSDGASPLPSIRRNCEEPEIYFKLGAPSVV
jgi:hypothetical protein